MIQERTIRLDPAYYLRQLERKRVAVYARVSTEGELKHQSIEAQKAYLKEYVNQCPDWEFVDYYADEGYTGTNFNRPEFKRMMDDARSHKLDLILTKTVSRLGRNISAVLKVLQELRSLNVNVIFDNDHLNTANPNHMLTLQTLAIQAEEEARKDSEYQKWAIRKRFKEGIPTYTRMYGYRMVDHTLIIVPEEAEIVKRIFKMYLDGMGTLAISKVLNNEDVPRYNGSKWICNTIHKVLLNEKYTGDMLLQKKYVPDYLHKSVKMNHGELPQYYVEDSHEAIIDKDTFAKVQVEIKRRAGEYGVDANSGTRGHRLFSQLIYCGHCHKAMNYKDWINHQYRRAVWVCSDYLRLGEKYCPVYSVREDTLVQTTREVLEEAKLIKKDEPLTNDLLKKHIEAIYANEDHQLEYHLMNGDVVTKQWEYESRSKSWTPEMREKARQQTLLRNAKKKAGSCKEGDRK